MKYYPNLTSPNRWLVLTLMAALSLLVYTEADNYAKRIDLGHAAHPLIRYEASVAAELPVYDVRYDVRVARKFILFGRPTGKVIVYSRARSPEGPFDYWTFENYYEYSRGQWDVIDSGICVHNGGKNLARLAFQVESRANQPVHFVSRG